MRFTRGVAIVLSAALLLGGGVANANQRREWRWRQCRFQGLEHPKWTAREERLTARCVEDHFATPGGLAELDSIITCESGWNRFAYNPSGPYVGLAQHALSAWSARVRSYSPRHWNLHPAWANSRTMLVITARMMRAVGLSPWACA